MNRAYTPDCFKHRNGVRVTQITKTGFVVTSRDDHYHYTNITFVPRWDNIVECHTHNQEVIYACFANDVLYDFFVKEELGNYEFVKPSVP
uniref:Uncharacterized protein n=1 Tax=viral metagenome TaxID=1070528 RepID=A0A6C0CLV9_9ZZZZ